MLHDIISEISGIILQLFSTVVQHAFISTLCLKKNDNDVAHYNFNAH